MGVEGGVVAIERGAIRADDLLGVTHVERNGHHFIDGFNGRPEAEARAFLAAHPDLYREERGRVRLRIDRGRLAIGSLGCPGFAAAATPDFNRMDEMPKSAWTGG